MLIISENWNSSSAYKSHAIDKIINYAKAVTVAFAINMHSCDHARVLEPKFGVTAPISNMTNVKDASMFVDPFISIDVCFDKEIRQDDGTHYFYTKLCIRLQCDDTCVLIGMAHV